jgi:hypothetical protein
MGGLFPWFGHAIKPSPLFTCAIYLLCILHLVGFEGFGFSGPFTFWLFGYLANVSIFGILLYSPTAKVPYIHTYIHRVHTWHLGADHIPRKQNTPIQAHTKRTLNISLHTHTPAQLPSACDHLSVRRLTFSSRPANHHMCCRVVGEIDERSQHGSMVAWERLASWAGRER